MDASTSMAHADQSLAEAGRRLSSVRGRDFSLRVAKPGDYPAIYHFLTSVFQGPSAAEFKASIEDPFCEPHDRLLIQHGSRIVAHAQLTHRSMQLGSLSIPVSGLHWLGAAPTVRGQGLGLDLLSAIEKRMADGGALVGLLSTSIPHFFRRSGWALCGRYCRSWAGARDVLAAMSAKGLHHGLRHRLNIRPWRKMERTALSRIYNQNIEGTFGRIQRSDAYWDWLLERGAFDQLFVALDGPDMLELEETRTPIVGYAATRGDRIVELFAAPGEKRADVQLLARACGEMIEQGYQSVTLHSAHNDRLHGLFRIATGSSDFSEMAGRQMYMARLLDPVKLLRKQSAELCHRAAKADLPRSFELGLWVDDKKYRLSFSRQGARIASGSLGRSYIKMNVADFTRIVLGHLHWRKALAGGRLQPSTKLAMDAGRALFPRVPFWRPPLDDLASQD
jgi:predicted N-acetyltransferase YhbS